MTEYQTTWDGLPISPEPPHGATIVVYRRREGPAEGIEFLILHRAHEGPDYAGEWAWTPPSGSRLPGEPVDSCARRELLEETGLALPLQPVRPGGEIWAVYYAEAPRDVVVMLDAEHDRYEWVSVEDALARCLPAVVGDCVRSVAKLL